MISLPTKSIEIHLEAIEPAIERVMAFGRQLLAQSPVQVLDIVEQQARRLLSQQREQMKIHLVYYPPYHSKYNPIVGSAFPKGTLLGSIRKLLEWHYS